MGARSHDGCGQSGSRLAGTRPIAGQSPSLVGQIVCDLSQV